MTKPAAERQRPDLQRDPGHRQQDPAADRSRRHDGSQHHAGQRSSVTAFGGQLYRQFKHSAAQDHQDQPHAQRRGGSRSRDQVDQPAQGLPAAFPARAGEAGRRVDGHRRDRSPRPRSRAQHPQRRGFAEEQRGQGQDDDQPGHDERGAADQGAETAPQPPRAEDRELRGGRAGQQVADRDRVLEFLGGQPLAAFDAQVPQHLDVGRRPAEPQAADPPPLPQDRGQRHRPQVRRGDWPGSRRDRAARHRAAAGHEGPCPGSAPSPASR